MFCPPDGLGRASVSTGTLGLGSGAVADFFSLSQKAAFTGFALLLSLFKSEAARPAKASPCAINVMLVDDTARILRSIADDANTSDSGSTLCFTVVAAVPVHHSASLWLHRR
jgi:hypothetical protein